jgi:hypothetical protein
MSSGSGYVDPCYVNNIYTGALVLCSLSFFLLCRYVIILQAWE